MLFTKDELLSRRPGPPQGCTRTSGECSLPFLCAQCRIMPRIRAAGSVPLLLLYAVASHSTEIEVPEMGVRLTNLPEGTTKSKLFETLDSYSTSVQIGSVSLNIMRLEDPAPVGASLTDATYRKALQDNFGDDLGPKARGQTTFISGNTAWTLFTAVQPIPAPVVDYTCITYVIANDHPYRLRAYTEAVYSSHTPINRPPDFDAAVQAMSYIKFEPVTRPPSSPDLSSRLKLPRYVAKQGNLYPDAARARNEEGVVDVEFSIDGKGHARDVKQTFESSSHLAKHISEYLNGTEFRVPANWEERGLQASRFNMEFQFVLATPSRGCGVEAQPRVLDATVITVCGSRLPSGVAPGAPTRTPQGMVASPPASGMMAK